MAHILPLAGLFVLIAFIIKTVFDSRTRNKLIEKGLVDERAKYLYQNGPRNRALSALKWGMVCIGIGFAALIGRIAYFFIFGGAGFLIYYLIARRETD